jgi:uncharacterized protein
MADGHGIAEYRRALNKLLPLLEEKYNVESLALFGSYVRAEQHAGSDLDILVDFREKPDLFTFIRLELFLEDALGVSVDLVMKDALKPHIGEQILREATESC